METQVITRGSQILGLGSCLQLQLHAGAPVSTAEPTLAPTV